MPLARQLKTSLISLFMVLSPLSQGDDSLTLQHYLDQRYDTIVDISATLWDLAEVGYLEQQSSAYMQQLLASEGFKVTAGVADIPTAFVAEYGNDGPLIGLLAEFDALPGINQSAQPFRDPVPGKGAGQACGHHLFGAGSIGAALAIKHWLDESGVKGRVRLYGTPAEEGGSGKVYMVRAGLFNDVDAVVQWHPADHNSASARTSLANRSAKFRFRGVSAHAAGAPHKARSALDAVEAMNFMVNLMREHIPQESRIHYVITEGGNAPNVVPDFAEVFYYVRNPEPAKVKSIFARVEDAARAAALGTGTDVEWEIIHGNMPVMVNETLQKVVLDKLNQVGGITYTAEEQAYAEKIYQSFDTPTAKLGDQETIEEYTVKLGYGSTDVGDVSIAVPTSSLRTATWVPGTSAHSWQAVAAGGTSIGYKGALVAAKVMALTAQELYQSPGILKSAKAELAEKRGKDFVYEALLGDRKPPLDYRK